MKNLKEMKIGYILVTILIFCGTVLLTGCSGDKPEPLPQYEGWQTYSYKHFVYHYPENSYWGRHMDAFSAGYEKYLTEDCEFLAMEIPKDTIHFYIHNNGEEGKKLTGREMPFVTENQIHWDRVPPFGTILTRYLVEKMHIRRTDYDVLYEGLVTLRDYSGRNFHHSTAALIEMKRYIPLDSLIDNEVFARAHYSQRNIEGASLVAFITFNWGINRFKMLWQSTATFDRAVQELFDMELKTFEKRWLEFTQVRFEGLKMDTVFQDTTVNK